MTPEFFERCGRALYGENCHDGLARALEVNNSSVRNWCSGKSRVPPGIEREVFVLLTERLAEIAAIMKALAVKEAEQAEETG